MELKLSEKSYVTDFVKKFLPNQEEKIWELTEKINYAERGKILAVCYRCQVDEMYIQVLKELVEDMLILKGITYEGNKVNSK
jgi:hypothetical protein